MVFRTDPVARLGTVAIVGCGFSGAMVAVHLDRLGPRSPRVLIFERGNRLARGTAYGTTRPEHLLNVPARLMSALPDEPDHFLDWLRQRNPAIEPGAFVARRLYGDYLEELLKSTMSRKGSRLVPIQAEIVDLMEEATGSFTLVTSEGTRFGADAVVLAVGNPAPQDPIHVTDLMRAKGIYISNPWIDDPLRGLDRDDPIIVIGTGLTAVDLIVEAETRRTAGKITAISRHGLTPLPHHQAAGATPPPKLTQLSPPTARSLLRVIRTEVRQVEENGGDWRSVIDSLRPALQELWKSLGDGEHRRFLRHLAPYWDVHRHRVAPEIHRVVDRATRADRLIVIAGRIQSMTDGNHGVQVVVKRRGSPAHEVLQARRVINCTGPARDVQVGSPSLIGALCARGLVRPDPTGLGLQICDNATLTGAPSVHAERIFAIGPLLKGELWETTAVRELRVQAVDLARYLAVILEGASRISIAKPHLNLAIGLARPLGTD
jgi:uncharacterized NAD(P)/FAD-binding protein YdhS